jgi:hypothetical protein
MRIKMPDEIMKGFRPVTKTATGAKMAYRSLPKDPYEVYENVKARKQQNEKINAELFHLTTTVVPNPKKESSCVMM